MYGERKINLISEMITASVIDKSIQYSAICTVTSYSNINRNIINKLMKEDEISILPKSMSNKIIHFYRIAVLYKKYRRSYFKWLRGVYKVGIAMGLLPETIKKFLHDFNFCKNFAEGERVINMYFPK